jgi:hypothetical protein
MHDSHTCAICAAEFASSQELVRHERMEHSHSATTRTSHQDARTPERDASRAREGREFTRRSLE